MPVTDYQKTIMYKIVCNDLTIKDCYVGHTINMTKRKHNHKSICHNVKNKHHNLKIYQIIRQTGGWSNWSMILVEEFPCKDKNEACKRERQLYEEIDANMNMVRPYRTQEELKLYYQDHKEEIKQNKKKKYHEKQYYQDHKEQIKLYQEANKQEIAEKKKQYYHDHKEQIKLYYQIHKEEINKKIECEFCAKLISNRNMKGHHNTCKSKPTNEKI